MKVRNIIVIKDDYKTVSFMLLVHTCLCMQRSHNRSDDVNGGDQRSDDEVVGEEETPWIDISEKDGFSDGEGNDVETEVETVTEENMVEDGSEEVLSQVTTPIDAIDTAVTVIGTDGVVEDINGKACEIYNVSEDGVVGRKVGEMYNDQEVVWRVLQTGGEVTDNRETVVVDGDERVVERTVRAFYVDSGEMGGVVETAVDITDEVALEEQSDEVKAYQEVLFGELQDKMIRLAEGDLTFDVSVPEPESDFDGINLVYEEFSELNSNLMMAVDNYRDVLTKLTLLADDLDDASHELSANSEEVTASIEEISHSAEEMSMGSQELAEQTDRADASVSELTATIEEITASVQEIDAETSAASKLAVDGVESGTEAVDQIRTATIATSEITEEVRTLEERMDRVDEALTVITEIADQTNILALNASIEAARAGDAGNGFAVVADEVKKLAEKSKESASEIEEIITEAQCQTETVASEMKQTNTEVKDGAEEIEAVVNQLDDIESSIEQVSVATAEVSTAVESQAENMDEFGATIDSTSSMSEEMSASVQQISAGIEQQSTASEQVAERATSLSATSEELYERIEQFRLAKDETANLDGS